MKIRLSPFLLPFLVALASGCQDHTPLSAPGPGTVTFGVATFDVDPTFNPQPEPPGQIFLFTAEGALDGEWVGRLTEQATGEAWRLDVVTESVEANGETLRLFQVWILHPPDPVIPPDPVRVALAGTLNLANGLLVLNGIIEDGQVQAHVRGEAVVGEAGAASALGELMFNPQPEPPGQS